MTGRRLAGACATGLLAGLLMAAIVALCLRPEMTDAVRGWCVFCLTAAVLTKCAMVDPDDPPEWAALADPPAEDPA